MKWHRLIFSVLIIFVCLITQGFPSKLVFSTNMTDSNGRIYEFNFDTGRVSYILTNLQSDVYSIAYDNNNGYIYIPRLHKNEIQRWLYYSTTLTAKKRSIRRSRLDGTRNQTVIEEEASDLSIDFIEERLYWMNFATGDLKSAYLNGTNDRKLFSTNTTIQNVGMK